jgi:flagellar motor switch protein FliN
VGKAGAAGVLEDRIVLFGKTDDTVVAVSLDEGFLSLFSQAMLGDALTAGDEGADDLLRELAAQAYGAIRSTLSGSGKTLPQINFDTADIADVLASMPAEFASVAAELTSPDGPLKATILYSVAAPAPQHAVPPPPAPPESQPSINISPAAFPELGHEAMPGGDGASFGLLAEVELEVTVELGRRRLALADVLRLTTGSVIELEKLVGEPLQVYANNRLIAEGEAVVIDEQFGIRITNLISNARRTKAFI